MTAGVLQYLPRLHQHGQLVKRRRLSQRG